MYYNVNKPVEVISGIKSQIPQNRTDGDNGIGDWGVGEPSGEECVVLDSALKWKWNSVRCVISASAVCVGRPKGCMAPDARDVYMLPAHSNLLSYRFAS